MLAPPRCQSGGPAAPLARDLLDGSAGLGGATGRDGDADVGLGVDLAEVVEADFGDLLALRRELRRAGRARQGASLGRSRHFCSTHCAGEGSTTIAPPGARLAPSYLNL